MANPERLDMPVRLVPPAYWAVLACFVLLVCGMLAWASFASAPLRISGQGILIDEAGLAPVTASVDGQIASVLAREGQSVAQGERIALLSRSDLSREIADTRARLAAASMRLASLDNLYMSQSSQEGAAAASRLAGIARSRRELQRRAALLDERSKRIATLIPRGFIRRDEAIAAEIAVADVRERLASLDALADQIRIETLRASGEKRIALLDAGNAAKDLERQQVRLSAQLAEQTAVRAPAAGRIVELKVAPGDVVAPGSGIATLARTGPALRLLAIAYVPAGEGKRISPGMPARVSPRTVERAAFGELRGRVISVSALPATRDGMRQALRNDQLVEQLLAAGAVVEVRIALERDASTPSGYAWTSRRGPDLRVEAGTLSDSAITVECKRIISWLLPGST